VPPAPPAPPCPDALELELELFVLGPVELAFDPPKPPPPSSSLPKPQPLDSSESLVPHPPSYGSGGPAYPLQVRFAGASDVNGSRGASSTIRVLRTMHGSEPHSSSE
jgi:hypothetical protein